MNHTKYLKQIGHYLNSALKLKKELISIGLNKSLNTKTETFMSNSCFGDGSLQILYRTLGA